MLCLPVGNRSLFAVPSAYPYRRVDLIGNVMLVCPTMRARCPILGSMHVVVFVFAEVLICDVLGRCAASASMA